MIRKDIYELRLCKPYKRYFIFKGMVFVIVVSSGDGSLFKFADQLFDLTPGNILHRVSGLDRRSYEEVMRFPCDPQRNNVLTGFDGILVPSTAPQYRVYSLKWAAVGTTYIRKNAAVIDLVEESKPPDSLQETCTLGLYRSP